MVQEEKEKRDAVMVVSGWGWKVVKKQKSEAGDWTITVFLGFPGWRPRRGKESGTAANRVNLSKYALDPPAERKFNSI